MSFQRRQVRWNGIYGRLEQKKVLCDGPNSHRSHAFAQAPAGMTCLTEPAGTDMVKYFQLGSPTLVWEGRVGHGRHGGEAPALWGGPMMSALNFWSFSFKRKGRKTLYFLNETGPNRPVLLQYASSISASPTSLTRTVFDGV